MKKLLLPFALTLFIASVSFSQTLDATFGNVGKVITTINDYSIANAVAIQNDGKIIIGGTSSLAGTDYFTLVRYNTNGSLDNTFGSGGKAVSMIKDRNSLLNIAIQNDGKIVAGGWTSYASSPTLLDSGYTIVRYKMNGSLDSTFGNNGITAIKMANGSGSLKKLLVKPDGKILTAGTVLQATFEYMPVLVQFNYNGSFDSSFGTYGKVERYIDDIEGITDLALAKDGKILIAGKMKNSLYVGDFVLIRLAPNGSIDSSFGINGVVKTDFSNSVEDAVAMVVLPDSSIVLAGSSSSTASSTKFALAKYRFNGNLDSSFGTSGKVTTGINNRGVPATDLLVEPNGNLVVSGYTFYANAMDFVVAEYFSNGQLNSAFGNQGILTTDFSGFSDAAYASALQPDGKIILVGQAGTSSNNYSIALARYSLSVLPLNLLGFTAKKDGKTNLLQWSTTHEVDVDRFEIERSADGKEYSSITKMNAGFSHYDFTDAKPMSGINYYRLKMIDKDGKFEYSSVKTVNHILSFYVSVYPLPAKNILNAQLQTNTTGKAHLTVSNILGKTLITKSVSLISGINNINVNVRSLVRGIYLLKVITHETMETKQIIID